MNDSERSGLQEIIDNDIAEKVRDLGGEIDLDGINLADFSRRTGLSRSRARTLKEKGFRVTPDGRCGERAARTVMSGFEEIVDGLLAKGVTNSEVVFDRIASMGYAGGRTTVKNHVASHAHPVPAKRKLSVEPQGNRGRRFSTEPGEAYQMDRGFVDAFLFNKDCPGCALKIKQSPH